MTTRNASRVLPPLDDDVADKLMIFKVRKYPLPMPTRTPAQKAAFWEALMHELPMFVHFLDQWSIPEEMRCDRYGVKHHHDPELVCLLRSTSPEEHLAELIRDFILDDLQSEYWEGTASELETRLHAEKGQCCTKAQKVLTRSNSCGAFLGRLERHYPHIISRRTVLGKTVWRITNEKWIWGQEERKRVRREAAALRPRIRRALTANAAPKPEQRAP